MSAGFLETIADAGLKKSRQKQVKLDCGHNRLVLYLSIELFLILKGITLGIVLVVYTLEVQYSAF